MLIAVNSNKSFEWIVNDCFTSEFGVIVVVVVVRVITCFKCRFNSLEVEVEVVVEGTVGENSKEDKIPDNLIPDFKVKFNLFPINEINKNVNPVHHQTPSISQLKRVYS